MIWRHHATPEKSDEIVVVTKHDERETKCGFSKTTVRLSHVLRAVAEGKVPIHWVAVDPFGSFLDMKHKGPSDLALDTGVRYDLLNDDLTQQSEETVAFIYSVLFPV